MTPEQPADLTHVDLVNGLIAAVEDCERREIMKYANPKLAETMKEHTEAARAKRMAYGYEILRRLAPDQCE